MDFWSYPAKAQQAVKVRVSVSGALQPGGPAPSLRTAGHGSGEVRQGGR